MTLNQAFERACNALEAQKTPDNQRASDLIGEFLFHLGQVATGRIEIRDAATLAFPNGEEFHLQAPAPAATDRTNDSSLLDLAKTLTFHFCQDYETYLDFDAYPVPDGDDILRLSFVRPDNFEHLPANTFAYAYLALNDREHTLPVEEGLALLSPEVKATRGL